MKKIINVIAVHKAMDKTLHGTRTEYKRLIINGQLQVFNTREEYVEFNRQRREHGDKIEA